MSKVLKIVRADGGVSLWPIHPGVSVEAYLEAWTSQASAEWLPIQSTEEVDAESVPTDRTFRDAWGGDLSVRMDKAKSIHLDRLRAGRKPLLEALDVEYQRSDEKGDADAKARVAARKQALRDVTVNPAIDAAKTPEELSALTIESLT
jgi:hypothetical protein